VPAASLTNSNQIRVGRSPFINLQKDEEEVNMMIRRNIVTYCVISDDPKNHNSISYFTLNEIFGLGCTAEVADEHEGLVLMHFDGVDPEVKEEQIAKFKDEGRINCRATTMLSKGDPWFYSNEFDKGEPREVLDDAFREVAREQWVYVEHPATNDEPSKSLDHRLHEATKKAIGPDCHFGFERGKWFIAVKDPEELPKAEAVLRDVCSSVPTQ
jgi:hypothetical protein